MISPARPATGEHPRAVADRAWRPRRLAKATRVTGAPDSIASAGPAERPAGPAASTRRRGDFWAQLRQGSCSQALRWLTVVGLAVGRWATTSRPGELGTWLPVIIVSVALLLPEVRGIAIGGLRLDLSRTREEVAELRGKVSVLQQVTTNIMPIDLAAAIRAMGEEVRAQVKEKAIESVALSESPGAAAEDVSPPAPDEFERGDSRTTSRLH
jgi:hypothetical protein